MSALSDALTAAQAELPIAVRRDSQGQGYRYTSLDALIEATRPILTKHGLTIMQAPTYVTVGDTLRPLLTTRLECGDEHREFWTPLYVTDQTMQGLGAAITYARRYAWAALLGIASEEDTDSVSYRPDDDDSVPF